MTNPTCVVYMYNLRISALHVSIDHPACNKNYMQYPVLLSVPIVSSAADVLFM